MTAMSSYAVVVVDFDPNATSVQNRSTTSNNNPATVNTMSWDASTSLWTQGLNGQNNTIYASLQARIDSGGGILGQDADPTLLNTRIDFSSATADPNGGAGNPTESSFSSMLLWDSADFLSSASFFNDSPDSSLSLSYRNVSSNGANNSASFRFIIRDGATYYVSNLGVDGFTFNSTLETFTLTGETVGLEWASFDPTLSISYNNDTDPTNYNLGTLTFEERSFDDVTGVGAIYNASRTNNGAGAGARFDVVDFQAQLNTVPEPTGAGLLGFAACALYFGRRRK